MQSRLSNNPEGASILTPGKNSFTAPFLDTTPMQLEDSGPFKQSRESGNNADSKIFSNDLMQQIMVDEPNKHSHNKAALTYQTLQSKQHPMAALSPALDLRSNKPGALFKVVGYGQQSMSSGKVQSQMSSHNATPQNVQNIMNQTATTTKIFPARKVILFKI